MVTQTPPSTPASTAKPGLKKMNFGGLQKKKESAKTEYPILPDPTGELYALAKLIKQQQTDIEAIEGALEANKAALKQRMLPRFFEIHSGKAEIPSSISIPTTAGDVLVTFSSRYKKMTDESALIPILGEDFVATHFRQAFSIAISGDKLSATDPTNPDRSPAQEFLDDLQALVARHQAEDAVTYNQEIKPVKEFHEARHRLLTPEVNAAVDAVCPMIVMVKTKGRDSE